MSNNTARLAREWAEEYQNDWPKFTPGTHAAELVEKAKAAAEHILATTTEPTMADAEWDDEKHHLAGATTPSGYEVVMLWPELSEDDYISTDQGSWSRDCLTPNGKKYELREVGAPEQPEHPETLVTEQDYENAPEGTTVAEPGYTAWTKVDDGNWWRGYEDNTSHWMAGTKRDVLRWGWGE